jgi:hypothetical protein
MKILMIGLLSLCLLGTAKPVQQENVVELTCAEVEIALKQLEKWATGFRNMVVACNEGLWETRKGQCIAATMSFDSIVNDAVRIAQFQAKMECKEV